jgi:hypothetical protein
LAAWLAENKPAQIGPEEFEALRQALAPVSESYLRKQLRESGAPLAPLIDGVRQGNLDELEASLLALVEEYQSSNRQAVRKLVITAKDHARWTHKDENLLWLITWLENPPLFPEWVRLRKAAGQS